MRHNILLFSTLALGKFLSSCVLNDRVAPVSPMFAFQCPPVATLCVRVSTEERASVRVSAIWSHTKGHCLPGRTMVVAPTSVATCHASSEWGRKQHPETLSPSSSPRWPPGSTGTMNVAKCSILPHLLRKTQERFWHQENIIVINNQLFKGSYHVFCGYQLSLSLRGIKLKGSHRGQELVSKTILGLVDNFIRCAMCIHHSEVKSQHRSNIVVYEDTSRRLCLALQVLQ